MSIKSINDAFGVDTVAAELARQFPNSTRGPKKNWHQLAMRYRNLVVVKAIPATGPAKLYFLAISEITRQLENVRVNGKQMNWPAWMTKNNFAPYQIVEKGNNLEKKMSTIKFNWDFISYQEIENILNDSDETVRQEAIAALAPEKTRLLEPGEQEWFTPIDMTSLSNYYSASRAVLAETRDVASRSIRERNALLALKLTAAIDGNNLRQIGRDSDFGRFYLTGQMNLQAMPKIVRHAALGNCYLVDIQAATYQWRLSWAQALEPNLNFNMTKELVRDRKSFRERLAKRIGINVDTVKELITSVGFGATLDSQPWPTGQGTYQLPAIRDILSKERQDVDAIIDKLTEDYEFTLFLDEQIKISDIIVDAYRELSLISDSHKIPDFVKSKNGRLLPNRLLAYLYQQEERRWLQQLIDYLEANGHEILLTVHDAVYVRSKPNMANLQSVIVDVNGNSLNLKLELEKITAYVYHNPEEHQAHKQRIKEQEKDALRYQIAKMEHDKWDDNEYKSCHKLFSMDADKVLDMSNWDERDRQEYQRMKDLYYMTWFKDVYMGKKNWRMREDYQRFMEKATNIEYYDGTENVAGYYAS